MNSSIEHVTKKAADDGLELYRESTLLFVVRSGILRRIFPVGSAHVACTVNQELKALTLFDKSLVRYIQIMIWGYERLILESLTKTGTTVESLKFDEFSKQIFPLPPKAEQHRIVQKVDELMALCDRLEQQTHDQHAAHETLVDALLETLTQSAAANELADNWARLAAHFNTLFTTEHSIDRLKQTILQLAVMGRLVPQNANDEPVGTIIQKIKAKRDQQTNAGKRRHAKMLPAISDGEQPFELPAGWQLHRLEDLTDIQSGIAKGKKIANKKTIMLPYLRVANMQRAALNPSEIKKMEVPVEDADRYLVLRRDLLITEGGDWDKLGRTAIWDGSFAPITHQNHVFRASLVLDEQNELWLEKYLNSGFARQYFADSSKQANNFASINKTQLRSCTIPVPPLAEQHRIVRKVDELMGICDQLKARLNQAGDTVAKWPTPWSNRRSTNHKSIAE